MFRETRDKSDCPSSRLTVIQLVWRIGKELLTTHRREEAKQKHHHSNERCLVEDEDNKLTRTLIRIEAMDKEETMEHTKCTDGIVGRVGGSSSFDTGDTNSNVSGGNHISIVG